MDGRRVESVHVLDRRSEASDEESDDEKDSDERD